MGCLVEQGGIQIGGHMLLDVRIRKLLRMLPCRSGMRLLRTRAAEQEIPTRNSEVQAGREELGLSASGDQIRSPNTDGDLILKIRDYLNQRRE